MCAAAALVGRVDILQWARSVDPPAPWDTDVCKLAAEHGHWHVLKFLRVEADPPCPWSQEVEEKARSHMPNITWGSSHNK